MNLHPKRISLKTISLRDTTFLLSYGYNLNPIRQSIKQIGVLNPPILRKRHNAAHQIICGYKRIRILKELGVISCPCILVPAKTGDKESLLLSLYDNTSHRELNVVEKSMAIDKLKHYYSEEEIVHRFLPLLALHPHLTQLKIIEPLSTLEKEAKDALIEGRISEQTALLFSQTDRETRKVLFKFLSDLRLSVSSQAEVLEYISEIAARENLPVKKVVCASELQSLLGNKKWSQPQKGEAIRTYLRERRYPQFAAKEKKFKHDLTQLGLSSRIRLTPPPFFEGNRYQLTVNFEDLEELRKRLRELKSLFKNSALRNIIED